jgi:protein arginine N-methyltransferase 1
LSKEIAKENNITGCSFLCASSFDVQKNIQANIVVAETLGNFAYEENIIETLRDARRFLAPGGIMIPSSVTQWVAPVVAPSVGKEIRSWETIGHDLNWSAGTRRSTNNMYVRAIRPEDLLPEAAPKQWDTVSFPDRDQKSLRKGEAHWTLSSLGLIEGFAVWWEAVLAPGVTLSTSPFAPLTHWKQIFLPLLSPLSVQKGEKLSVTIVSDSRKMDGITVSWDARVVGANGKVKSGHQMDMKKG